MYLPGWERKQPILMSNRSYAPEGKTRTEAMEGPVREFGSAPKRATVLVVDDDESVLAFASRALEHLGYDVLQARDGAQAVRMVASSRHRVDLILMDLTMPGMDGLEAARRIREHTPDLPIILSSGCNVDDVRLRRQPFLRKPYDVNDLQQFLSESLDDSSARAG